MRPWILAILTSVLLLPTAAPSRADDLAFLPPTEMGPRVSPAKGPQGENAVEVTGAVGGSVSTLVRFAPLNFTATDFVLRGRIKYAGVVGDGHLETWHDFGDQGTYFTRSLADLGPLKKLNGDSDWREFELPFHAKPGMTLKGITFNVVLPGNGKVTVSQPLALVALAASNEWWTEQQSGVIGGSLGSLVGILGALIAVAASLGRSRRVTVALCVLAIAVSVSSLAVGAVAMCAGQPWHVSFPLLLVGVIGTTVLGGNWRTVQRRLQDSELRRMTAADVP